MSTFSGIDLSLLTPPDVVEPLDYEVILRDIVTLAQSIHPEFDALLDSDPAYKLMQVLAYRELNQRQRINEACRAVMLAYAQGADLDQIGANYDVPRLVISEGNPNAVPPIPRVLESDDEYRRRIQLSPEGFTTAGSEGSYVFHGLRAHPDVKDIQATSPQPGHVVVYVLSRTGTGTASEQLLASVANALNGENIRPMTDVVQTLSASIVNYTVEAELEVYPGPDPDVILQAAIVAITNYTEQQRRLGFDVTLSGVYAALHQPGVKSVNLSAPLASLSIGDGESSYCTSISVSLTVSDDA